MWRRVPFRASIHRSNVGVTVPAAIQLIAGPEDIGTNHRLMHSISAQMTVHSLRRISVSVDVMFVPFPMAEKSDVGAITVFYLYFVDIEKSIRF